MHVYRDVFEPHIYLIVFLLNSEVAYCAYYCVSLGEK